MKYLFYLQQLSIRTKFIVLTTSVFALSNILVALMYPNSVFNNELVKMTDHFKTEVERIAGQEVAEQEFLNYDEVFVSNLFSQLELLPDFEYVGTIYMEKKYANPADIFSYNQIYELDNNEIHNINERDILALSYQVPVKSTIGTVELKIGINADSILAAESTAWYQTYILILISIGLVYIFIFFFDKMIYIPFKKLINISRLVSVGQDNLQKENGMAQEFNHIASYMDIIAARMKELKQDNIRIPLTLKKSQEKAVKIQRDLDKEIEAMSNLILYILELRKEKSQEDIYKNLVIEITERLGYSVCFLFKYENNKLIYHLSNLKRLTVLDDKLRMDLKHYVITDQNNILKEMLKHNPLIQEKLPFDEILQKYNLTGHFAIVPVSTYSHFYGMMIAGNIGEDQEIKHNDLEKLMLLSNTVGLHIENINNLANLERDVKKRTSELETTNKLLSDSIVEKDTVLKLVSHDLNAPLRNVIGLVESIERKYKKELDTGLSDRLMRIRKNVEKELNMIDEILTNFNSTENVDINQSIDMNNLLESILEELNYELTRKNVKIELDDNLPVFVSNQAIMKHIFLNLIDNACKYLPIKKQGNRIKITYNYDKGYSIFQVVDNGLGIPKEKQDYVFDSYQRANTSPDESGGKGLGLALVKNMVGKINGEISFNSKEGQGTTFFIRFKNINNN